MRETPDGQVAALSLERYAEVVAHLLYFKKAKPPVVIERLGVDAGDWASAERTWSRAIGDELARQETALAERMAGTLTGTQQRLDETRPTLETVRPLAPEHEEAPAAAALPDPSPSAETSPILEAAPEPMPVPIVQLPSYALPTTAPVAIAAVLPAQPLEAASAASRRGPSPLAGTSLALDIPRGPAMPFVEGAKGAPPPAPEAQGSPPEKRGPSPLAGTSLSLDIPRGPAMPFVEGAKGAPPPAPVTMGPQAAPNPGEPQGSPPEKRGPSPLAGTSLTLDIPRGPATPFAGADSGAPAPASPPPALPLERYASLCVELGMYADRAVDVLARYRVTAADKAALDQHYQEVFAQRPGERSAFMQACGSYKAWLEAQTKR